MKHPRRMPMLRAACPSEGGGTQRYRMQLWRAFKAVMTLQEELAALQGRIATVEALELELERLRQAARRFDDARRRGEKGRTP